MGAISEAKAKIDVDRRSDIEDQWETLFHEIFHCICWSENWSEKQVDRMAKRLYGILRQNKLLNV